MESTIRKVTTDTLESAAHIEGAWHQRTALLLHGWPDDATTWNGITPALRSAGITTVAPWLRGCGQTRFLASATLRDGRAEALAADALDLMDALEITRFDVIGHDWGARAAYTLAAIAPERVQSVTAISLGYSPRGSFPVPPLHQSRAWWYQWFLSVDRGAQAFAADPKAFARLQWDTWSPPGWFDDATFEAVARSFENPDWVAITLSSYRGRWREEVRDPRYDRLHQMVAATERLNIPTLMIQGNADGTVLPESTEGQERFFTARYRRVLLDGVGHFPMREAPTAVADVILEHLQANLNA
ncbi:MAG: alpha/beta hydrolase [Candidatus Eremiobacteraeota bacterium]|nr:alpha/beta hydrolase [Candidatus Eremiobacteraeota bacterium]